MAKGLEVVADRFEEAKVKRVPPLKPIPDDPWQFILNCCYTYDELALTLGLDPKRKFPDKEYLKIIVNQWLTNPLLRIEKSRQIMVTWLLAALWLWWVLKHPGQRIAWVCKTFTDASDHIEKRVAKMYEQIPIEYEKPRAKFVDGEFRVYHDSASTIPTSTIEAIAAEKGKSEDAASQLRSFTYSGINWDEAPFQAGQEETYAAGMPCVGLGGRFNIVGSANGKNFVWRLGHGRMDETTGPDLLGCDTEIAKTELLKGLTAWDWNGFRSLRVHYSADPDKDPETVVGKEWYRQARDRMKITRKWLREMEISFDTPAGTPVYCDTDRIHAERQAYNPALKVYLDFDFGFGTPACIVKQVEPVLDENGKELARDVRCLKEFTGHNIDIANFWEKQIWPWMQKELPRVTFANRNLECFGDPAGNQKESTSGKSDIEVLAGLGVYVKTMASRVETSRLDDETGGVNIVQAIVSSGHMHIDPVTCPGLLSDMRGGYGRDENGRIIKTGAEDNSHRPDALRYGCVNLFNIDTKALHGPDRTHRSFNQPSNQPNPQAKHDANTHPSTPLTTTGNRFTNAPMKVVEHTDRVFRTERWNPKASSRPGRGRY